MRIISNFHDYYDSVMKQGMDKEIVYLRETKEILISGDYECHRRVSSKDIVHLRYLGFCGQIYKVYEIEFNSTTRLLFYDFEMFKHASLSYGSLGNYDFGRHRWWRSHYDKFNESETERLKDIFHKYQTPIFILEASSERKKAKLILNPKLLRYDFHRMKDVYSTYQDIFQYVSGVLNSPENKMVKISDADKIAKHGFDKWSFRQKGPKK